jgi:hypothetical protein
VFFIPDVNPYFIADQDFLEDSEVCVSMTRDHGIASLTWEWAAFQMPRALAKCRFGSTFDDCELDTLTWQGKREE